MSKASTIAICRGLASIMGAGILCSAPLPVHGADRLTTSAPSAAEGWKEVDLGIYERTEIDGTISNIVLGVDGFESRLFQLEEELEHLEAEYKTHPSQGLAERLEMQLELIESTEDGLRNSSISPDEGPMPSVTCTNLETVTALAQPLNPGAQADASGSWSSDCGYLGAVSVYTTANVNKQYDTHICGYGMPSRNASCSAHAQVPASRSSDICYSTAIASVTSDYATPLQKSSTNVSCGTFPSALVVSGISGPTSVGPGSATVTWTVSVSGGTAPYSCQWLENGAVKSTSCSSFTQTIPASTSSYTFSLQFKATDAKGQTAGTAPLTVTVVGTGLPPTITSFSPPSGSVSTPVTITGTNFVTGATVRFNGVSATPSLVSSTSIQVPVPAGATTGLISVQTNAGTAYSATNFTVTTGGGGGGDGCRKTVNGKLCATCCI